MKTYDFPILPKHLMQPDYRERMQATQKAMLDAGAISAETSLDVETWNYVLRVVAPDDVDIEAVVKPKALVQNMTP